MLSSLGQWALSVVSRPSESLSQHERQGEPQDEIPPPPFLPAERAHQLENFRNQDPEVNATNTSAFFQRLPPDIRRLILIEAFGDRIVHVDLQFLDDARYLEGYNRVHGNEPEHFLQTLGKWTPFSSSNGPPQWRWYGCLCHREPERRVRGHAIMNKSLSPPWFDTCLKSEGKGDVVKTRRFCGEWSGEEPLKCRVGAIGWLRTCRQA